MQNFYIYTFYFLFFLFFIFLFFGVGPSLAMWGLGWTQPSPAQPVTGPSRWPGWAEQHVCANARVLLQCASELKFTCTKPMVIKLTKKQRFAYLVLETEYAYSVDGSSPAASLYLPSALTCLHVPFVFSAKKVMKRLTCWELACCEFVLILGFRCLQGRRQWQSQYSSLCIAALLFSPSLRVLFFSLDLYSVFPLFLSGFWFFVWV